MSRAILALIILTLSAPNAPAARGAGRLQGEAAEADRLNAQAIRLYREGKYEEALPVARRVLELREQALGGEDLKVAYALANLGNIHARKGDHKEAETLFTRALAVAEKRGAAETDFAADLNTQLGLMRVNGGKFKEGEPLLRRVLDIKEKVHGAGHARTVPALLNLADINFLRGQTQEAQTLLGRALDILGRQPYVKDAETAKRLRKYYCPLVGPGEAETKELTGLLGKIITRLDEPEKAAEFEKLEKERKEREARGEGGEEAGGGDVLNGRAISKPQPSYPNAAKQQRIGGTVVVQIFVDESGKVARAEALCGHPILAKAAVESALDARFTPTLLAGKPVKVSGVITYNFVLQ